MGKGRRKERRNRHARGRSTPSRGVSIGGNAINSILNTGDLTIVSNDKELVRENVVLEGRISNLSSDLSRRIEKELEDYRESFREGRIILGFEGIQRLRDLNTWSDLDKSLQASIIRAEASTTIGRFGKEQIERARELVEEASTLDPNFDDGALRLNIECIENGYASVKDLTSFNSIETYNIWLAILLNTGRLLEVVKLFANPPQNIKLNAESHRFYALAFLATGQIDRAREEIEKAKLEKPSWLLVRYTGAIIDYYSALSPQALTGGLSQHPQTISLGLVRSDDTSQELLKKARLEFNEISALYLDRTSERHEAKIWEFACLANTLNSYAETIEFGNSFLEEDPGDTAILFWFFFRGYEYDYAKSLAVLDERILAGNATVDQALCVILLNLAIQQPSAALKATDDFEDIFRKAEAEDYRLYWRAQADIQTNKISAAKKSVSKITDPELKRSAKISLLSYECSKSNDPETIFKYLKVGYAKFKDDPSFLAFYEFNAKLAKDTDFIESEADRFCELSQTSYAVDFAARTLLRIGKAQTCNDLLLKYEYVFPNGRLPFHLRQLRIAALQEFDIKAASSEAALLSQENNSIENLSMLIGIQRVKGDLLGLQVTARSLLRREDASSKELLRAAQFVAVKDRPLAARLWKKALEHDFTSDPGLVAFAQGIASKLGLERESRGLMRQMMSDAAAGRGPMKQMLFADAVAWMRERNLALSELNRKYGTGEIPVHLWVNQRGLTLVQLFQGIAAGNKNETDVGKQFRIMGRSGARLPYPTAFFDSSSGWTLHLDVSTLILADYLGILDLLESQFRPIKISRHVVTSLIEQRDNLMPHQRSQLDNSRSIIKLFQDKKLRTFEGDTADGTLDKAIDLIKTGLKPESGRGVTDTQVVNGESVPMNVTNLGEQLGDRMDAIASAVSNEGCAVGFLPLTSYNAEGMVSLEIPVGLRKVIVNARSIAQGLFDNGRISKQKFDESLESLGVEGIERSSTVPEIGSKIFLMPDVEKVLEGSELLSAACDNFEVYADVSSIERASSQIDHYENLSELDSSLDVLIDRINQGIEEGQYEFITLSDSHLEIEKKEKNFSPEIESALELLAFDIKDGDVIGIDDRSLTRHAVRIQKETIAPLLGINEILQALLANGIIDEDAYFEYLMELRQSNYRYIPISPKEIRFHLDRADIKDNSVVETNGLRVLRQYASSCLLDKEFLDLSNTLTSELPFVVQSAESSAVSIVETWKDEEVPSATAAIRANWILENLYIGRLGCLELISPGSELGYAEALGTDLCGLYVLGLMLHHDNFFVPHIRRQEYFSWLYHRVVSTTAASSPDVVDAVGIKLKDHLLQVKTGDYPSEKEYALTGYVLGRFVLDLPERFRRAIDIDEDLLAWLHIKIGNSVAVADNDFAADQYWSAVEEAVSGGIGHAHVFDDPERGFDFVLDRGVSESESQSDNDLFPLIHIKTKEGAIISSPQDPIFAMLLPILEDRLKAIKELREWFDCDDARFNEISTEICETKDSISRVTQLYRIRETSTSFYYRDLENRFGNGGMIAWNDLLPSWISDFTGYFRLPPGLEDGCFIETWESAAEVLLSEQGLESAISKCSCLPLKMPGMIVEAFKAVTTKERIAILKNLGASWASPIRRLHLANLAARSFGEDKDEEIQQLAEGFLAQLYSDEIALEEFHAFVTTFTFVYEGLASKEEEIHPTLRLFISWAHASALYQIQRAVNLSPALIISSFGRRSGHNALKAIERGLEARIDCSSPAQINRTRFLTHAAAKLFDGVDSETLATLRLPELIRKEVFRQSEEGNSMPSFTLLHDPNLSTDQFRSLFGADRFEALAPILGDEGIDFLRPDKLKETLETYLKHLLEKPEDIKAWLIVFLITNDLPIHDDLKHLCRKTLKAFQTDKIDLGIDNPSFLLFAAAEQVSQFDDPALRSAFRDHILAMLRMLPDDDNSENSVLVRGTLVDAALSVFRRPDGDDAPTQEFVQMLESMLDVWPNLKVNFGEVMSAMVWDARADLSKYWWRLNMKLRADRESLY